MVARCRTLALARADVAGPNLEQHVDRRSRPRSRRGGTTRRTASKMASSCCSGVPATPPRLRRDPRQFVQRCSRRSRKATTEFVLGRESGGRASCLGDAGPLDQLVDCPPRGWHGGRRARRRLSRMRSRASGVRPRRRLAGSRPCPEDPSAIDRPVCTVLQDLFVPAPPKGVGQREQLWLLGRLQRLAHRAARGDVLGSMRGRRADPARMGRVADLASGSSRPTEVQTHGRNSPRRGEASPHSSPYWTRSRRGSGGRAPLIGPVSQRGRPRRP